MGILGWFPATRPLWKTCPLVQGTGALPAQKEHRAGAIRELPARWDGYACLLLPAISYDPGPIRPF